MNHLINQAIHLVNCALIRSLIPPPHCSAEYENWPVFVGIDWIWATSYPRWLWWIPRSLSHLATDFQNFKFWLENDNNGKLQPLSSFTLIYSSAIPSLSAMACWNAKNRSDSRHHLNGTAIKMNNKPGNVYQVTKSLQHWVNYLNNTSAFYYKI